MAAALSILYVLIAYLVGSFSPAYTFTYLVKKTDIRKLGDKNPGTFNTSKVLGAKWGVTVGIIDVGKGFLLTLLPFVFKMPFAVNVSILAGIAVVIGHSFPVYYKFKGGMGIAPTIGALGVICWKEMVWTLIIWFALLILMILLKKERKKGVSQFIAFLFLFPFELFYHENIRIILGSLVLLLYFYIRRYAIKKTIF